MSDTPTLAERLRKWTEGYKFARVDGEPFWVWMGGETSTALDEAGSLINEAADVLSPRAPERTEEE